MKYIYKNKEYDAIKVDGKWRIYTSDMNIKKEEAEEVLKSLEKKENNKDKAEK